MPKLILIDGSNQAFRAYYAIRTDLRAPDGRPTRALFGFSRILQAIIKEHQPDFVAAVFDVGPSFRNELYPQYKGQRPDKPEDLSQQWPMLMPLCEQFGVRSLGMEGFEADDIIGTLAVQGAAQGMDVRIVSSDKDFAQLVNDRIMLLDPSKGVSGTEEVKQKWGVGPESIVELMALMGDKSDNVPGVAGVGPKKAAGFIQTYRTAMAVVDAAKNGDIKGKTGAVLAAAEDVVRLSRTLVTIRTDLNLGLQVGDLALKSWNVETLRATLSDLGFFRMITDLGLPAAPTGPSSVSRDGYRLVDTAEALAQLVADIRAAGRVAMDCETTSLDALKAQLVGMSFCWSEDSAVYVPIAHTHGGNCPGALDALLPLLADPSIEKIGQNLKYDLKVLLSNGHRLEGIVGDTMLVDYLLEVEQKHNLDSLALRHLDHQMIAYKDVAEGIDNFADVPVPQAMEYAAEDAHVVWLLDQKRVLENERKTLYTDIEVPLLRVLAEMELRGIGVDVAALKRISVELDQRIKNMIAAIHKEAGETFNVNSTQQLATILFEKRGHKPVKKTKKGYSTNSQTLNTLMERSDDKLLPMILDYRELAKLKNTYVDKLPDMVAEDGRIHTSFHQAIATTGRLASFDPNLQNIPIRTDEGRRIRECFVAREGHVFLSADYSQVELRVLAHFCETGPLVESFLNAEDIHRRTAAEIYEVKPEDVTDAQRRAAKAINFGIIYGMSAFRLSREIKISRSDAKQTIDNYFARYPQVRKYMDDSIASAKETGHAKTLFGRIRPVPGIDAKNAVVRGAAERVAMNTPVQGTAADLIKMAMLRVDRRLKNDFPDAQLLLQVHDELVVEVPSALVDAVAGAIREEMEGVATLRVPLKVEVGHAKTWAGAH